MKLALKLDSNAVHFVTQLVSIFFGIFGIENTREHSETFRPKRPLYEYIIKKLSGHREYYISERNFQDIENIIYNKENFGT